jgi:hypothetical protein
MTKPVKRDQPLTDAEAAAVVARARQLDLRDAASGYDDAAIGRPTSAYWMMGSTRGWGRRWS